MATDAVGKKEFNLDSPRTRVAMKINGVTPKDISPKAPTDYEIPDLFESNKDLIESRYKMFEKKRQQLVKHVAETASVLGPQSMNESKSDTFLTTSDFGSEETQMMQDLLQKEAEKIEKLKQQAKHDITKLVKDDITAKKRVEESLQRQAESAARMLAIKKVKAEGAKEARKAAEKANERKKQIRESAIKKRQEECEEISKKLGEAAERATAQLEENMKKWETRKAETAQKSVLILDRREKYLDSMQKRLESDYYSQMGRDSILETKMAAAEERRRINAEDRSAKYTKNRLQVQHAQAEQQANRENAFLQSVEKFGLVQEAGASALKSLKKEIALRNNKAAEKHKRNMERVQAEQASQAKEMQEKIAKTYSNVELAKVEREQEIVQRRHESRSIMTSLVLENRERIKRADEYNRAQSLSRIQGTRHRVDSMLDTRKRIAEKRVNTVKECFLEKHHLTNTIEQLRDAPAWKYNKMLRTLDLEFLSSDKKPAEDADKD